MSSTHDVSAHLDDALARENAEAMATTARRLVARLAPPLPLSLGGANDVLVDPELVRRHAVEVSDALTSTVRLLRGLNELVLGASDELDAASNQSECADLAFDDAFSLGDAPAEKSAGDELDELSAALNALDTDPRASTPIEELQANCAMLSMQLSRAKELLRVARRSRDPERTLVELEEARRRTLKALRMVVDILHSQLGEHEDDDEHFELESTEVSLRVRDALFGLRASFKQSMAALDRAEGSAQRTVLESMRAALTAVLGAPVFAELRAPDRRALTSVARRFDVLLAQASPSAVDLRHLVGDIDGCFELFCGINHRAVLVQHDHRVKEDALASLRALQATLELAPRSASVAWTNLLGELRSMRWRSADLDAFVDAHVERGATGLEVLKHAIDELFGQLSQIRV